MGEDDNCSKKPYVKPPKTCSCRISEGPGPFATQATFKNTKGQSVIWNSRFYRKHKSKLDNNLGTFLWAPSAVSWWIGILFAVGATCFAFGSFPLYVKMVSTAADNLTYFIRSLFFTSAAYLQYLETINAPIHLCVHIKEDVRFITWEPHRVDWWSTLVQFGGTLLFNISTLAALQNFVIISQINRLVWTPDLFGSICFLIASYLAFIEIGRAFWSLKPSNISWRIAALNLIGSIAFGVSAIASYIFSTGVPLNLNLSILGTFIRAVCFLIGAVLLLPERMMKELPKDDRFMTVN